MVASCQWPITPGCLPEIDPESPTAAADYARLQACMDTAVGVLWAFTGRQFGCCPRLLRPCPQQRDPGMYWSPGLSWFPVLDGGVWRNLSCGCGPSCQVGGPGVVHLPGPVCEITAVTVDGVEIPTTDYVLEGDRLYATSGEWPTQDLTRPAGSPGTWSVEYGYGRTPPAGAGQMVALLAREFWEACTGGKCRLPSRTQSLTRQGVAIQLMDPAELFADFQTGITEIDLWIAAHNPHRLSAPPAVSSPDYVGGAW